MLLVARVEPKRAMALSMRGKGRLGVDPAMFFNDRAIGVNISQERLFAHGLGNSIGFLKRIFAGADFSKHIGVAGTLHIEMRANGRISRAQKWIGRAF